MFSHLFRDSGARRTPSSAASSTGMGHGATTWPRRCATRCRRRYCATGRRPSRWRRSSTARRGSATAASTSGSSPTWPPAPPSTTSSAAAAASTPSTAAAPRCPSSSRVTSWSSPTSATPGPSWQPPPTTAPASPPSSSPSTSSPTCLVSCSYPPGHHSCEMWTATAAVADASCVLERDVCRGEGAHPAVQRPGVLPRRRARRVPRLEAHPGLAGARHVARVRRLLRQGLRRHLGAGGDAEEDQQQGPVRHPRHRRGTNLEFYAFPFQ